jgi:arabinogalactan endo-1,4-beta-galactosidase
MKIRSICVLCALIPCLSENPPARSAEPGAQPIIGADVSSLPCVEAGGGRFRDGGVEADALGILKAHRFTHVRLRLWHSPADGRNGLEETLLTARRAKAAGFGLLLDIHYSDTWADPGRQTKPAAWTGLPFDLLADSVRFYTAGVLSAFRARGIVPDIVQIGNEISCGMLWNEGRTCGAFDTPPQWDRLSTLVSAGFRGVRESSGGGVPPAVMIHFDDGGDGPAAVRFLDAMVERGAEFDLIGLSYYPWWHGPLDGLASTLDTLSARYGRGILIVETAYPWTLGYGDDTHNPVGLAEHLLPGYPATADGQRAFIEALSAILSAVPGGRGLGFFYWEPCWIAAPSCGSPWENLALFDFSGDALASIDFPGAIEAP